MKVVKAIYIYNAKLLMQESMGREYAATIDNCVAKIFKGGLHDNRFGQWPKELIGFHLQCYYI